MEIMKFSNCENDCCDKYKYNVHVYRKGYYRPDNDNVIFDELINLKKQSSLHGSIINDKIRRCFGSGLLSENIKSQALIKSKYNKIIFRLLCDYIIFGGCYVYIQWNIDHTNIVNIKHIPFQKVRKTPDDIYLVRDDWKKDGQTTLSYYKYDVTEGSGGEQVLEISEYSVDNEIYPIPSYFSGITAIQTDINIATFFHNTVKNNFGANIILEVPRFENVEKKDEFERHFKKKFTGVENAGSILVLYNSGNPDNKVVINKFNNDIDADSYLTISRETLNRILFAHSVPSPLLYGIETAGSLGNSTELMNAENIYESTVIAPVRNLIYEEFMSLNNLFVEPLDKDTYIKSQSVIVAESDVEDNTDSDVQTQI